MQNELRNLIRQQQQAESVDINELRKYVYQVVAEATLSFIKMDIKRSVEQKKYRINQGHVLVSGVYPCNAFYSHYETDGKVIMARKFIANEIIRIAWDSGETSISAGIPDIRPYSRTRFFGLGNSETTIQMKTTQEWKDTFYELKQLGEKESISLDYAFEYGYVNGWHTLTNDSFVKVGEAKENEKHTWSYPTDTQPRINVIIKYQYSFSTDV